MNQQQVNDNTIVFSSPFSVYEGVPFYQQEQDKIDFYHEQKEGDQNQQAVDDFKPTFYNPFEIKHRRRTSRAQFKVLEKTFLENPKPNAAIRRWLAQKLSMTPRGVQVWFQNRRAKEKTATSKKMEKKSVQTEAPVANSTTTSDTILQYPSLINQTTPTLSIPSSPVHSICACQDCQPLFATPMSRTTSYPPFYSSDGSTTADEEEFLMTPVTPFVDQQQQQQFVYDSYPIFMNNDNQIKQQAWINSSWPALMNEEQTAAAAAAAALSYFNNNNMRRTMYPDNMMFDSRRYSCSFTPEAQSNEFIRRLSEPIFDQGLDLIDTTQFNLLPRNTGFM